MRSMADSFWQRAGKRRCHVFGIEKYLGFDPIKSVGSKFAKKIVQKFGTDTLENKRYEHTDFWHDKVL